MENQTHNVEVAAYIKDYLNNENFAQFAVLLTGKWGSGKTHFILDLKKQYENLTPYEKYLANKEFNWVYVSLNGIETVEEIQKRIILAAYSWLNNKVLNLGQSFLSSIVASPQIYGVSFDSKKFMKKLEKLVPKIENAAFIFDDIERCRVPLSNLFGYINNFVEHDRLKVILVADEDKLKEYYAKEIAASQQDPGFSTYEQVKEKLIGQTLEIKPDIKCALDVFIGKLNSNAVKELISANKNTITDIFKQSHTNNLRSLKTAFFTFERLHRFLSNIEVESKQENEIYSAQLSDLLLKIIAITLEYRAGIILQPSEIVIKTRSTTQNILSEFLKPGFDPKTLIEEFTANNKKQKPITYYTFLEYRYCNIHWQQTAIEYSNIGLFIEKGLLPPKQSLIESFKQDYQLRKPHQDDEDISILWIRLFYWKWQSPKVLEDNLPPLLNALNNQKFNEMGDILQVIGLLTMLSDYDYNPLPNEQEIDSYFEEYLHLLTVRNIPANIEKIIRKNEPSYKGYGISDKINPNLRKLVYENTIERAIKTIKKNGNLIEFIKKDNFAVLSQEQYMSLPLMNLISPADFANLINFTGEINYEPLTALKNRYRSVDNLKEQEKDWLEQLKNACLNQINKMDAPFKTQRKNLFDHEFKDLE